MLEENAMLCKVAIYMWNNESVDNESAQELATTHKVEKYTKVKRIHLPEYCLDRIRSVAGNIRLYHSANTLPFLDRGIRLLPSTNYFDYIQGLSERRVAFDAAVEEFITQLPVYIADAKQKFGSKFDASYIPSVEELRKRFRVEPVFMPIANASDWRIQLEAKTVADLKTHYEHSLDAIKQEATAHLWAELEETVSHFIEKLETPKARIHDTLVPNLLDKAKLVKRLNTLHDKDIDEVCDRIIQSIDGLDTFSIKTADSLKSQVLQVYRGIKETIYVCRVQQSVQP
jgi:hypothetical protein